MADVIDELVVKLGLEQDAQSFREAKANFAMVTRAATAFTSVIAAGVGGTALVAKLAGERHEFSALADAADIATGQVDRLGFALEQAGGSEDNALNVLRNIRDLRDQAAFGEGGLFDAGMFGIDVDRIISAQDEMAALIELSRQFQGLSDTQRNRALDQLGLSGPGIQNLLRGGPSDFQSELDRAAELRTLTEEEIEVSRELSQTMDELSRAVDELGDDIVMRFAPAITSALDKWVDHLTGEGSDDFDAEAYRRSLTNNAGLPPEALGARVDEVTAPRGGYDVSDALLDALAMQESGGRHRDAQGNLTRNDRTGALGAYQILPSTAADPGFGVDPLSGNSREEHERFAEDYLEALLGHYDGNITAALSAYHTGVGTVDKLLKQHGDNFTQHLGPVGQLYAPDVMNNLGGRDPFERPQASVTQNITIHAEGQDPQYIRRELARLTDSAVRDTQNRVS
ncbi:lytic transglycosylase domain-containing protein [Halomonas stenophila]|uniref:Transglycosylase SLT domain-containing protein n=1 Tax=Halomonas stenophila TaxID=795312 RepID=A0A7W5EUN1_9GAMM|nr:lytic transglycosylase domain-containing protein [Halomonas stenophila]MBB3231061.1 hypothetical protein [Halomonas stenophila]